MADAHEIQPAQPAQSVRDKFMQRLSAESGRPPEPAREEPGDETRRRPGPEPAPQPRADPDRDDDAASPPEADEPETIEPDEGTEEEGDEFDRDPRAVQLREQVKHYEEREKERNADYTRKTQRIAEAKRVVEKVYEDAEGRASFFTNLAQQNLATFNNVDWQALRATPERYQAAAQAYQAALNQSDQLTNAQKQLLAARDQYLERVKAEEAEVSLEILRSQVPGWNNDRYCSLREFAVAELGWRPEEVNDWTDWRLMSMVNRLWEVSKAPSVTKGVKRNQQPKPPLERSGQAPVRRSADGKFQNARDRAFARPGDKQSFRDMKQAALRREAEQRRGRN